MKKQYLLMIGLATLVASATQAYSQEQLAKSIQDTRTETVKTSLQLRTTLGALNGLTQKTEGDLRPAYNTFATEVTNTMAAAATTAARVKWMDGEGQDYFKEWQNNITTIANESLRKKSQKRLETVRSEFDEVKTELKEAGVKFKPFLSDLSDIQKTLASDVTAAGVDSVRSTVKSANRSFQPVNRTINSAVKELEKMAKALSPQAK